MPFKNTLFHYFQTLVSTINRSLSLKYILIIVFIEFQSDVLYLKTTFQSEELFPKNINLKFDFLEDENSGTSRQRHLLNESLARILILYKIV